MELKLFHYVHCPYCVRVRMALGYLKIDYTSVVLPYDDEKTPIELTGKKMLPIFLMGDLAINESLDIIARLDTENKLLSRDILRSEELKDLEEYLNHVGFNIHNLTMPYWIFTPEFNENSRDYFRKKKEVKRGPFKFLVRERSKFEVPLVEDLNKLKSHFRRFYRSNDLTLYDIMIAAHLWGLYIVPEFRFPSEVHDYLQSVKGLCGFNYHGDFWK